MSIPLFTLLEEERERSGVHFPIIMSAAKIAQLYENLSLVDEDGVVHKISEEFIQDGVEDVDRCLVGKVLSGKKVNREAFKGLIEQIWSPFGHVEVELVEENTFMIGHGIKECLDEEAKKLALDGLPTKFKSWLKASTIDRSNFRTNSQSTDSSSDRGRSLEGSRELEWDGSFSMRTGYGSAEGLKPLGLPDREPFNAAQGHELTPVEGQPNKMEQELLSESAVIQMQVEEDFSNTVDIAWKRQSHTDPTINLKAKFNWCACNLSNWSKERFRNICRQVTEKNRDIERLYQLNGKPGVMSAISGFEKSSPFVTAGEWFVTTQTRSFRRHRRTKPRCPLSRSDTINGKSQLSSLHPPPSGLTNRDGFLTICKTSFAGDGGGNGFAMLDIWCKARLKKRDDPRRESERAYV
ncbi:hypothetical protein EZV62_024275 [Acer yangbiense]|uniref:DUF4283 domain-containing protein n=1 Tax=Acer yangbiense TaxID=1000413 RepID=A0A5C7H487_9ROSI|nr:hypothetical protein EZV62_024275 [Acer yangbiense]